MAWPILIAFFVGAVFGALILAVVSALIVGGKSDQFGPHL